MVCKRRYEKLVAITYKQIACQLSERRKNNPVDVLSDYTETQCGGIKPGCEQINHVVGDGAGVQKLHTREDCVKSSQLSRRQIMPLDFL